MNATAPGTEPLTDRYFKLFNDVVYTESGIHLSDMKKALMQARLLKRMRELGLHDFGVYYRHLQDNYTDELEHFINCITTNKTDFFREPRHFDYIREAALPAFERAGKNLLSVWSAGCSTGEEPYTIAITFFEYFRGRSAPEIKILATDIDTKALQRGAEGTYAEDTVAAMGEEILSRYFLRGRGEYEGLYRVKDFVKKAVYFRRLNLTDESFPMKKAFDMIFCRNVIIYFDRGTQERLFARFHRHLADDGFLFTGHSETSTVVSARFKLIQNTVYRKT